MSSIPIRFDPSQPVLCAKQLLAEHGEKARDVAEAFMLSKMDEGDVKAAGEWLTVMHELHKAVSQQVN